MKRVNNKFIFILGLIFGLIISITTVYAVDAYIESNKVTYTNHNKTNVEEAIDELYERSGIHKEKWVDPELHGADPVLKDPLIPVEIKSNGDVYYANLNSEWYNYNERRWANAVILVDEPTKEYTVGAKIEEDDIESYFVWIPRYKYKVWDLGKYTETYTRDKLTEDVNNPDIDTAFWKVAGNNSKLIEIVFGNSNYVKIDDNTKQGSKISGEDTNVKIGEYLIHPAFTLGNKDLNGIWVGKFETGYKGANSKLAAEVDGEEPNSIIIKPNVFSWRSITVKNMFMSAYNYESISNSHNAELDPHMMKNTEWGAVAYLSHSKYGIGNNVNVNNNSEYKTGYGTTANVDQKIIPRITGTTDEKDKTQPWNTAEGYLASTTGNISGIYDIGGGAWEYVAACMEDNPGASGFKSEELKEYMDLDYIDKYDKNSTAASYNMRILGDATGEMGPFYSYLEGDGKGYWHSSWYANSASFVLSTYPWFARSSQAFDLFPGQFIFGRDTGQAYNGFSFRIALAIQ